MCWKLIKLSFILVDYDVQDQDMLFLILLSLVLLQNEVSLGSVSLVLDVAFGQQFTVLKLSCVKSYEF